MTLMHMDEQHKENQDVSSTSEEMNRSFKLVYQPRPSLSQEKDVGHSICIRHSLHRWNNYGNVSLDYKLFLANLSKNTKPIAYAQASISPNWIEAINE